MYSRIPFTWTQNITVSPSAPPAPPASPTSVAGAELSCTGCGDGDAAPGVLLPLCSAEPAREGVGVGAAVR